MTKPEKKRMRYDMKKCDIKNLPTLPKREEDVAT